MYESMTYEGILQRMLDRVKETDPDLDTREGSVLYDILAPAAAELQIMYREAEMILEESFADTASRYYLIKRAAERGMLPNPATAAVCKGEFNTDVPIGARFSLDAFHYTVTEKIRDGVFRLTCETEGQEPNSHLGTLVPVDYLPGLETAELTELLIPGEDEEETEAFRARYFETFGSQSYGFNVKGYQEAVNALQGVGGVKVYPVWNGGGTVKLVLLSSLYGKPTQELIDTVKETLDPAGESGKGAGIVPIGHVVTVEGVQETRVDVSMQVTYQEGWIWEDIQSQVEAMLDAYFLELRKIWQDSDRLVVRISQIETRMLNLQGVLDITGTSIQGVEQNLQLDSDCIPVRGSVYG